MKLRTGYLMLRTPDGQWLGEKSGKKKTGVWYACWTVGGRKFRKTTKQSDHRDATKELARMMEPFAAGAEVTVLQNIAAKIDGRTAELARFEDESHPPVTIARAWDAYLAAPGRPDSGERTLSDYEGYFTAFSDWLKARAKKDGFFDEKPAAEQGTTEGTADTKPHPKSVPLRYVTRAIAGEYAAHLLGRNLSGNSFNKHIGFLRLLWRILQEDGRLPINPWQGIKRKRIDQTRGRRELTTTELQAVCAAATGEMRLLFAIGVYTGLRLGDCATLRWAEVDLARGLIRRVPNKTARRSSDPLKIPIHTILSGMLAGVPKKGEFVLPEFAALYLAEPSALSKRIHDHFETCGVTTHRRDTGIVFEIGEDGKPVRKHTGKRASVEVGFHSLRHTFVSLCREANAPLAVVEAIVGHSNPAMTRHYTHVSEAAAGAAVASLPSILSDAVAELPATMRQPLPDWAREQLAAMTDETWRQIRGTVLA